MSIVAQLAVWFMENCVNARIKKFVSYYKPYQRLLVADLACASVVSACTLILPLCVRSITNTLVEGITPTTLNHIYTIGGIMLVLILVQTVCNTFVDYQGHMMGTLMESDMRDELFAHYQRLSFGFYDEQKTGQLMTRLTNDLESLSELYHHGPEDIFIASLTFFGTFIILMTIDVKLTLILFFSLPFVLVYALYTNKHLNRALRISRDRIGDINAQVEDSLAGIRVVQSFTNEQIEQEKFAHQNNRFIASRRDVYKREAYFYEPLVAYTYMLTLVVVVFGGVRIVDGTFTVGDVLTYVLYSAVLIEPIHRYVNFARLYQEGITGFDRFMDVLEVQPDLQDRPHAIDLERVQGHVEFVDVSFKYKEAHTHVLKNLSLTIHAGEYVALVGSSGVGKTTVCSLIPRFYDVTEGQILLDGRNIKDIRLSSLRRNIGVVQQDVYLFAGTVLDNIRYGKRTATIEEVIAAAKQASAHDFIMALPDGYATDIGQRGIKLSGGQKQRLSLARVFLKDPPILIFDEATSALDNESEKAVQASLAQLATNRTTLVIAHRLSTIKQADRIIVLTDHGIAEQGTHDELIDVGGAYAHLYNIQLRV